MVFTPFPSAGGPFGERSYGMFNELTVNGQQVNNNNDNDQPTDYTAGGDDNGGQTTPAPADAQDTPPEPAEGGENSNAEDYTQEGDDTPPQEGGDNPQDAPEDYTVPDESDGTSPEDQPAEGEGAPEDYTGDDAGGDQGGQNPNAGDEPVEGEGGGDPGQGDPNGDGGAPEGEGEGEGYENGYGDDDQGGADTDTWDGQIRDLEKQIYADLDDAQAAIRDKELKQNFVKLYELIEDISERINDISKDADMLEPMEFIANKLNDLSDQVSDYIAYTYSTKTYTENNINYNRFVYTLSQINQALSTIKPGQASKKENIFEKRNKEKEFKPKASVLVDPDQ